MAATLSSIDPLLKEVYQPRIREQLNTETVALKRIEGSSAGVTNETGGRYVTFPLHTRRNSGVGSRLETEALPTAGQQGYTAARTGLKYAYGSIQLTGQSISLSDSEPKAFARVLDQEMTGIKDDILKDMNRQVYGLGNGAIATVTAAGTASTTVTVNDTHWFQINEVVDIITAPSTVASAGLVVTAVNPGAGTITLSSAVTTAIGQIITRTGSGPAASGNREMTGLGAIINNTGVIYNVDPTVEPLWESVVQGTAGSNTALTEDQMITVIDLIRINGGKTSLILTSLGVRRAYWALLTQLRTFVNTQEFTGGFKGLAFTTDMGEVPVVSDPDSPKSQMLFVNEDHLTVYRDEDWHWLDRDQMWHQVIDSAGVHDAWFATMARYHELGTDRRNTHGILQGIAES